MSGARLQWEPILVRAANDHADTAALQRVWRIEELERKTLAAVASRELFTKLDSYDGEVPQ